MAGRLIAIGVAVTAGALLLAASGTPRSTKEGGTFRVGISGRVEIDPALAPGGLSGAACAGLMATPDQPLPAGLRLVPEIAADYPVISRNRRTYTFTIRSGFRFSTGKPVAAADFAASINRILNPALEADVPPELLEIVGARRVLAGKAKTASGVIVRRGKLIVRLLRPVPSFPNGMTFCVLPASLPFDPEGVRAPVPSAGPYFISEYVVNERVVLERNRYYGGSRPHHVSRFLVTLGEPNPAALVDQVDRGELDYAAVPNGAYAPRAVEFTREYGVNKGQFWVKPGTFLRMFVLNTSRPLFRNNPKLRQAVNFAVDRKALLRERGGPPGGQLTDQYLMPTTLGFRDERIYPLQKPDLRRAKALARGHLRDAKAVLYTSTVLAPVAQAQVVKDNLAKIGINVDVQAFPVAVLFEKLATPGEPFDIGWIGWGSGRDPASFLNGLFYGRTIGTPDNVNYSYFNSTVYNRLLDRASQLTGDARARAFGDLDVRLSRDAAPAIPYSYDNTLTLVSARTGCVIVNPYLDLAAVCLK